AVLHGAPLNRRDFGRHANDDARTNPAADLPVRLPNEMRHHFFCGIEISDDAVSNRPDRTDMARTPAEHFPRRISYRFDRSSRRIEDDNRWFAQNHSGSTGEHAGVRRAEIDRQIGAESKNRHDGLMLGRYSAGKAHSTRLHTTTRANL